MSNDWDDTFDTGDELTAAEWNEHVQDQKNRIVDEDGSVNAENVDFTSIDGAGNIVIGNDDVIISVLNVSEEFGLPSYEDEEDAPDDSLYVLEGEGLRFKDEDGTSSNAGGVDVLSDGTLILTSDELDFGEQFDISDEDGTATIELSSDVSADITVLDTAMKSSNQQNSISARISMSLTRTVKRGLTWPVICRSQSKTMRMRLQMRRR